MIMVGGKELRVRDRSARPAHSSAAEAGFASDLAAATFDRPGLLHDKDIPSAFRSGAAASSALAVIGRGQANGTAVEPASTVISPRSTTQVRRLEHTIASGVRQLARPRRSNGRVVLRRVGWRATPEAVVITIAEQELTPRGEKRYAPGGPWLIEQRETYRHLSGRAGKRVGVVPADPAGNNASANDSSAGPSRATTTGDSLQADVAHRFPEGAEALSFLPRAVRASIIATIPAPTVFDGTVLEISDARTGRPARHEVNVLRMAADRAVVVRATRLPGSATWDVTQAAYRFGDPEIERV